MSKIIQKLVRPTLSILVMRGCRQVANKAKNNKDAICLVQQSKEKYLSSCKNEIKTDEHLCSLHQSRYDLHTRLANLEEYLQQHFIDVENRLKKLEKECREY